MDEEKTFIRIDRNMLNWYWFQTPNTAHLFIYLLIRANTNDKRGQMAGSLRSLSQNTGLSIQQVRTALKHLISTGEITVQAIRGFRGARLITLLNYDEYQADQPITDQETDAYGCSLREEYQDA